MPVDLWKISPNLDSVDGPEFVMLPGRTCQISFRGEDSEGRIVQTRLIFESVEAFRCTHMTSRSVDMISTAYEKLVDLGETSWLAELRPRALEYYRLSKKPAPILKHMAIYFDDGPYFEFICQNFDVAS